MSRLKHAVLINVTDPNGEQEAREELGDWLKSKVIDGTISLDTETLTKREDGIIIKRAYILSITDELARTK